MSVAVMEAHASDVPVCAFDLIRFRESSSAGKESRLGGSMEKIAEFLEEIPQILIEAPSLDDFRETREKTFPQYVKLSVALSNLAVTTLTPVVCAKMSYVSYSGLENDFREAGMEYFSDEQFGEALFLISTLKSAQRLIPQLLSVQATDRKRDSELAHLFSLNSLWSQFHLDCLSEALKTRASVDTDVVQEMFEGLRRAVMAYGYAREAIDLRGSLDSRYSEQPDWTWDSEDQALADTK